MKRSSIRVFRVSRSSVDSYPPLHPIREQRIGRDLEAIAAYGRAVASLISGSSLDGIVRVTLEGGGVRVMLLARGGDVLAVALIEDGGETPSAQAAGSASEASEAV